MKDTTKTLTRRRFVQASMAVALIAPASAVVGTRPVAASELVRLEENEASARALKYVHDAAQADPAARGGDDRVCLNCRFYTDAAAMEWGPCTLFPGKAVRAGGWCSAWAARSS